MKDIIMVVWAVFMLFAICYLFASTIADAIGRALCDLKCKQCKKHGRAASENSRVIR